MLNSSVHSTSHSANGSALKESNTASSTLDTPDDSSFAPSCHAPGALAHSTTIRPCFCAAEDAEEEAFG